MPVRFFVNILLQDASPIYQISKGFDTNDIRSKGNKKGSCRSPTGICSCSCDWARIACAPDMGKRIGPPRGSFAYGLSKPVFHLLQKPDLSPCAVQVLAGTLRMVVDIAV